MAAVCELCGKGPLYGRKVARTGTRGWVKRRTKRKMKCNLRRVKILVGGRARRMRLCTSCLKSAKVGWEEV